MNDHGLMNRTRDGKHNMALLVQYDDEFHVFAHFASLQIIFREKKVLICAKNVAIKLERSGENVLLIMMMVMLIMVLSRLAIIK